MPWSRTFVEGTTSWRSRSRVNRRVAVAFDELALVI
jgi:hypothetical protein